MSPYLHRLSASCADLLDRLMTTDPAKRITIDQAEAHPWLQRALQPELQAAWEALEAKAAADAAWLATLPPDQVGSALRPTDGAARALAFNGAGALPMHDVGTVEAAERSRARTAGPGCPASGPRPRQPLAAGSGQRDLAATALTWPPSAGS